MARRDDSIPHLLIKLPWWVGVIVAGIVYAGMRWVFPAYFAHDKFTAAVARAVYNLAPLGGLFFLMTAGLSVFFRAKRRRLIESQTSIESLRALDWQAFEWMVAEAYRRLGFKADESITGGADGGVDVVLRKDGQTIFVQCKQWKHTSVGSPVIRDLYGAMTKAGASRGIVITSGRFTRDAQDFAEGTPIELINGDKLLELLKGVQQPKHAVPNQAKPPVAIATNRICPKCGAGMILRTAMRGANAGNKFWGCSTYPICKATLPLN